MMTDSTAVRQCDLLVADERCVLVLGHRGDCVEPWPGTDMSDVIRYRVLADKYAAAQEVVDDQATQLAAQQATIAQLAGDLGCADSSARWVGRGMGNALMANQDLRTARDRLAARLAAVSDLVGAVAHALALHDTIMAATPPTSAMYHESRQRWEAMRTALAAVREEPGG